ncbi:hypothetical protein Hanom_Chr06g00566821 [Helianthus anomalus]
MAPAVGRLPTSLSAPSSSSVINFGCRRRSLFVDVGVRVSGRRTGGVGGGCDQLVNRLRRSAGVTVG